MLKNQRESWHGADRDWGLGHTNVNHYGSYDGFFQCYSECMRGMVDSIGKITEALEALGQLDDTVIIQKNRYDCKAIVAAFLRFVSYPRYPLIT